MRRTGKPGLVGRGALLLLALASGTAALAATATPEKARPNIILIYMDDMGYGDVVTNGATGYQTPNLDRLAAEGTRFTQFDVVHPVCSASRAALMTGCYSNRVGLPGVLLPGSEIGLNPDETTLPEMLQARGYATAMIGKWHLGDRPEFMPLNHGFEEFFGLPYSNDMWRRDWDGTPYGPDSVRNPIRDKFPENIPLYEGARVVREIRDMRDQEMLTSWYTERAVQFLERKHDRPFFLYLAHAMPHFPLAVSDKFKGRSVQGLFGDVMMEIDWSIGEVLHALDRTGLSENTLVIFASDNGAEITFGEQGGSTGGLRGSKVTTWEGGHRVPCLMRWPGVIPAGRVNNRLAANIDLLPTLAAITGATLPDRKIDGVNILPMLEGDTGATPRTDMWYYDGNNNLEAVRQGYWKLVFPHPYRVIVTPGTGGMPGRARLDHATLALYDLRRDPAETTDVQEQHPEIVAALQALAARARADLGDDLTRVAGNGRREPGRPKR
jgi:arylsulfatase